VATKLKLADLRSVDRAELAQGFLGQFGLIPRGCELVAECLRNALAEFSHRWIVSVLQ
jgi:hypothetical protein